MKTEKEISYEELEEKIKKLQKKIHKFDEELEDLMDKQHKMIMNKLRNLL